MKKFYLFVSILLMGVSTIQAQLTDVVTGLDNPSRLFLNGTDLYYSTASEIFKIDITENSPTPVSVIGGLNGTVGMAMEGNTLYFSEFNAGKISKIDITDPTPTAEVVISGLNTPGNLLLDGNTMYYSDPNDNFVAKFDVTDPNPSPVVVATSNFNFNPSGLAMLGNILYMGQGQANRVSMVDVTSGNTQPTDVVVGVNRPLGIRVVGNNLFIAEYIGNKISKKDLSNGSSTAEEIVSGISSPTDIEIAGNTLFILEKGANKISKITIPLGVNDLSAKSIHLFPNPATSFIQVSNLQDPQPFTIYAIDGSKVARGMIQPNERINIENLSAGAYVFTVSGASTKFIKN